MTSKYNVGDVILQIKRFSREPLSCSWKIEAVASWHGTYYYLACDDCGLPLHEFTPSFINPIKDKLNPAKFYVSILERDIISVQSALQIVSKPISSSKEMTLFELAMADSRQKTREENARRPYNSAFEFL